MSAVDTPHLILFEFFIKIQALLQEPFVFRLVCTFLVCVYGRVCVCLHRRYGHYFSLKCSKLSELLHISAHTLRSIIVILLLHFFFLCILHFGGLWGSYGGAGGIPGTGLDIQLQANPFSSCIFCARDPDIGFQCRSPQVTDKAN